MERGKRIISRPNGPFATNFHIIAEGAVCHLVDAPSPASAIIRAIEAEGLELKGIWLTHGHADHIMALRELKERWSDAQIAVCQPDVALLDRAACNSLLRLFGMREDAGDIPCPDIMLKDGDSLPFGYKVIASPGHTPGSACFMNVEDGVIFTGDTLFASSVGRTDLGGDFSELNASLRRLMEMVPDGTAVLPGHGIGTTMGREKRTNPYLLSL